MKQKWAVWQVVQASGSFPSPSCPVPEGNCKLLYLRLLITIPFQERRLEVPSLFTAGWWFWRNLVVKLKRQWLTSPCRLSRLWAVGRCLANTELNTCGLSHIAEGGLSQTGRGLRPQFEGDVGAAAWEGGWQLLCWAAGSRSSPDRMCHCNGQAERC